MINNKEQLESVSFEEMAKIKLHQRLESKGVYEKYSNVNIIYLGKGILSVSISNNTKVFYEYKNGEITTLFNLKSIRDNHYFQEGSILAGYKEIDHNGIYELFNIKNIDLEQFKLESTSGNIIKNNSYEYYQAWKNIYFFQGKLFIETFRKKTIEGDYPTLSSNGINAMINAKALKIKDLEQFKKQGQISDILFNKILALFQNRENNLLLQQIGDERFERIAEGVTKEEIEDYYNKDYITKDLYNLALEKIEEIENLEDRKQKEIKKQLGEDKKAIRDL